MPRRALPNWLLGWLLASLSLLVHPPALYAQPPAGAGVYKAWSTAADGSAVESTLFLNSDSTALLVEVTPLLATTTTQSGQWAADGEGLVVTWTANSAGALPDPQTVLLDSSVPQQLVMAPDNRRFYASEFLVAHRDTLPFNPELVSTLVAERGLAAAYKTFVPTPEGSWQDLTLTLFPDARALLERSRWDPSPPSLTYGAWQDLGNGQMALLLTESDGGVLDPPADVGFVVENGLLRALNSSAVSGTDLIGVPFYRLEGLAAGAVPAETVPAETVPAETVPAELSPSPQLPPLSPALVAEYQPTLGETPCPEEVQGDPTLFCSYLTVPENRSNAESRSIEVLVVKLAGLDGEAPDPLIVLAGHPDDAFFDQVAWFANAPARAQRSIYLLQARGSQPSRPSLACPSAADSTDPPSCAASLRQQGYDLAGYTLDQRAYDVVDLAQTLAAESINLLGNDIGAAVAQRVAERAPGLVRTIALESPLPLGTYRSLAGGLDSYAALSTLFADCARERACAAAYPDLETHFLQLIDWYNAHPTSADIGYGDGTAIAARIFQQLQAGGDSVPALIHALYTGDFSTACRIAPAAGGCLLPATPQTPTASPALSADSPPPTEADGGSGEKPQSSTEHFQPTPHHSTYYTLACSEEAPHYTQDDLQRLQSRLPPQVASLLVAPAAELLASCPQWQMPPAATGDRLLPALDVPALILAGAYDPVTPARWARRSAADFDQPFLYVFAGQGHNLLQHPESCAHQLLAAFLERPQQRVNAYCFHRLHAAFELPPP